MADLSPTMEQQLRALGSSTLMGFSLVSARKPTLDALRRRALVEVDAWAPTRDGWQHLAEDPGFARGDRETASLLATGSFKLRRYKP